MLTGTIINSLTILAGSAVGLVLRAVTRRSSKEVSADGLGGRLQTIIMQGMALCVLYIGVSGCLKGQNTLTAILSIALGAIIGELLDLDRRMRSLGDWVQTRTARLIHTEDGAPSISDGTFPRPVAGCGAGLKRRNDAAGKRRQLCVGWRYLLYCGGGRYRVLHTIEKEKQ